MVALPTGDSGYQINITMENLPSIMRDVAALQRRIEIQKEFKRNMAIEADEEIGKLQSRIDYIMQFVAEAVHEWGQKTVKIPGVGTVRLRPVPGRLNQNKWDELTPERKEEIFQAHPNMFARINELRPNAQKIATFLRGKERVEGAQPTLLDTCFTLDRNGASSTATFTANNNNTKGNTNGNETNE